MIRTYLEVWKIDVWIHTAKNSTIAKTYLTHEFQHTPTGMSLHTPRAKKTPLGYVNKQAPMYAPRDHRYNCYNCFN